MAHHSSTGMPIADRVAGFQALATRRHSLNRMWSTTRSLYRSDAGHPDLYAQRTELIMFTYALLRISHPNYIYDGNGSLTLFIVQCPQTKSEKTGSLT